MSDAETPAAMNTEQIPSSRPYALSARGVGVSFGGLRALDGVDLDVEPGAIIGVIGPNGAGKTTLFDAISGFIPCEGRMWVNGVQISGLPPHRRAAAGLGRSFQDARLFHAMTVLDTLRVACELHVRASGVVGIVLGLPGARGAERAATARALELVELFGLGGFRDKLIRELSTGTRRIVDLACVLAHGPSVVMLDEPSSGIAQRETEALGPLLRRIRDRTGCAMLLIEHDMPLLLHLAERVYALETGRVIASGDPEDVVHDPEVIRSYLGADAAAINRSGALPDAAPKPRATRARRPAKAARSTTSNAEATTSNAEAKMKKVRARAAATKKVTKRATKKAPTTKGSPSV
ncbi:MAG TPA: ABC transporter ATP-binding protein [Actinomycetota bacterium]